MISRTWKLSEKRSFFLFGPRGAGKSTLLKQWARGKSHLLFDLLDPSTEAQLSRNPNGILENWHLKEPDWIIIDEVQKNPKLLDVVQTGIVKHKIKFALTGSSASKLKRGSANLLGGRATEFHLHPFSCAELKKDFDLLSALQWGTLPELITIEDDVEKVRALFSYVSTYLKEEILVEQIIRKIEPYRRFLEVAAQCNGKILNFAKIGRDSGVEERSVARYYQILEDTLLGFFLDPFEKSIRKRQSQKSKFYFFDCGVTRALQNSLTVPLFEQTYSYGDLFEQFVILEFMRMNDYSERHFRFSYLLTKDDVEVDLIIERPGAPTVLVEIKSSTAVNTEPVAKLRKVANSFNSTECYILSNATSETVINGVRIVNWRTGLSEIFA